MPVKAWRAPTPLDVELARKDVPYLRAVRQRALANVVSIKTMNELWRVVRRVYSQRFHTPLHVVDTLDQDEVYLAYFEDLYSNMPTEEQHKLIEELLSDVSEEVSEEDDVDEWVASIEREEQAKLKEKGVRIEDILKEEAPPDIKWRPNEIPEGEADEIIRQWEQAGQR